MKSDYKVVVGRSTRVTGPYVDKDGRELTRGGGSLVVDSNDEFVAIGHSAAYDRHAVVEYGFTLLAHALPTFPERYALMLSFSAFAS